MVGTAAAGIFRDIKLLLAVYANRVAGSLSLGAGGFRRGDGFFAVVAVIIALADGADCAWGAWLRNLIFGHKELVHYEFSGSEIRSTEYHEHGDESSLGHAANGVIEFG